MAIASNLVPEKAKSAKPYVDPWTTDESTWVYITIPDEDALGHRHPSVSNNKHVFEAGNTYHVPKEVAEDVNERLKVYAKAAVRILQPKRDLKSERQVSVGTASHQATAVDPSTLG